ncbi:hypothetical protein SAMN05192529_11914 [Arachidicoccus rhizosphaerae]|uniref:DUF4149 domain-containing protein n=1 Tax=Arachidicoccus rhizosphaerae TaxID=551991 RepID=A0A1H4B8J0_9BACT|nr:hypothetical protein [Arachidicoccus rhizosphaerae]SEA44459.1 hypothetical protein SAMN05192529_11914 [Arachidicoccus rhizosphaerae]
MNSQAEQRYPYALPAVFLWIGFLMAISFMEAWLKFRAPGVTITIGLGIGKLVFGALNKVEWVLIIITAANFFFVPQKLTSYRNLIFIGAALMTALETFWGLPALDKIADQIIAGGADNSPSVHIIYVSMEVLKLILLILLGTYLVKKHQKINHAN